MGQGLRAGLSTVNGDHVTGGSVFEWTTGFSDRTLALITDAGVGSGSAALWLFRAEDHRGYQGLATIPAD